MSSTTTTTATPIPAPTNTINPLPDTPAEAAARPAASGAALDLHTQTEDAADQYQSAQRTEKAYNEKKKCMSARKDWYDCKVHFAAGVQGFREGGKCVGRVVKASPSLVMEKVNGVKGKGVKGVDSETSGDSLVVEKEAANEKGGNGERVKAKVAGLKEKLLAIKEKRAVEKTAKANEKAGVVTAPAPAPATETATATEAGATPAAPVAATPAPAPAAPTKQEKKRMTLDQVRKRLLCFHSHFSKEEEDDSELNVEPRIAENSTRGSQGPREAGSGSLNRSRRSSERSPSAGANSNGDTIPNISINDQPTTTPTQDPVIATGLPNPEHHGADSRGQGDNTSSQTSVGGSGSQGHGGSWGRSSGTSVGASVGEGGLKARVAIMVRGRLRGGDASSGARRRAAAADEKGKEETDGKGNGVKGRVAGYFQRRRWGKSTENRGGSPFKRPGRFMTLRLRVSLFVSKVRDGGSDARPFKRPVCY